MLVPVLLACCAIGGVRADPVACTDEPTVLIENFADSTLFDERTNLLGGDVLLEGVFTYTREAAGFARFAAHTPAAAWITTIPVPVDIHPTLGAMLAFDFNVNDPAPRMVVAVNFTEDGTTFTERELEVGRYVDASAADGAGFAAVRIPFSHFTPLPHTRPVLVQFKRMQPPYDGTTFFSFDNLRVEYHRCPRRLLGVPPQTCSGDAFLVLDYTDPAQQVDRNRALPPGYTYDDGTMAQHVVLSELDEFGPGLLLQPVDEFSYWYTVLNGAVAFEQVNLQPFTSLRITMAADVGTRFHLHAEQWDDNFNALYRRNVVEMTDYVTFQGLDVPVQFDLPLVALGLHGSPLKALAFIDITFTEGPGQPRIVLRSIELRRDCEALLEDDAFHALPMMDSCGPSTDRTVALTFDGGPSAGTIDILDLLLATGVPATFFVTPNRPDESPPFADRCAIIQRMVSDGHAVGHGGWTGQRCVCAQAADRFGGWVGDARLTARVIRWAFFFNFFLGGGGRAAMQLRVPGRHDARGRNVVGHVVPADLHRVRPDHRAPAGRANPAGPAGRRRHVRGLARLVEPGRHRPGTALRRTRPRSMALVTSQRIVGCSLGRPAPASASAGCAQGEGELAAIDASLAEHLLLHYDYPQTVILRLHDDIAPAVLEAIIDRFQDLDYTFVTVPQCRSMCVSKADTEDPDYSGSHRACWDRTNPTPFSMEAWIAGIDPTPLPTEIPTTAPPTTAPPTTAPPTTVPPTEPPTGLIDVFTGVVENLYMGEPLTASPSQTYGVREQCKQARSAGATAPLPRTSHGRCGAPTASVRARAPYQTCLLVRTASDNVGGVLVLDSLLNSYCCAKRGVVSNEGGSPACLVDWCVVSTAFDGYISDANGGCFTAYANSRARGRRDYNCVCRD